LRAALLRGFEQAATEAGCNAARLLASVNIGRSLLRNPESRISAIAACRLLEHAADISGHGDFGLRVAMAQGYPDFGPLALLLREEPDVRSAVRALSDNLGMNTDVFSIELIEDADDTIIQQNFDLHGMVDSRQMNELTCARLVQILRQLIGEAWKPRLICFSHDAPVGQMQGYSLFRCPVEYDHDFTGIIVGNGDLDTQLRGANEDLKRYAEAYLRTLPSGSRQRFDQRVANVIVGQLARGVVSADRVAEQLGITRRTLNRKLGTFGHSYSSILRVVREEKLSLLLEQDEKALSEISSELGFQHPSAFSTWFHDMYACAPSEWRKARKKPATNFWWKQV
jgi:AraC-like DNA-binding protein